MGLVEISLDDPALLLRDINNGSRKVADQSLLIFIRFTRQVEPFLSVEISQVKFNVNTEYAYLQNFKIFCILAMTCYRDTFTKHSIERAVPLESLIKCMLPGANALAAVTVDSSPYSFSSTL